MSKQMHWASQAKVEYISQKDATLISIAQKYKKAYAWVRKVALREGWVAEKKKRWNNAEKQALEEVEGSIKDLIKRHSRIAKFLQAGSLTQLKTIVQFLQENPRILQSNNLTELSSMMRALTAMSGEGLKAERELYPKQMQIESDIEVRFDEVSDELKKAAHDALIKQIIQKPRKNNKHR